MLVGLLVAGLGLLLPGRVAAQPGPLQGLTRQFSQYARLHPYERLFLHLDRPLYLSGETAWFTVYAVGGPSLGPLALSSVAYVEVLDAGQQPVLQTQVALTNTRGQGTLTLPASLASGNYTVRAYTRWMQNEGPEAYFHQSITLLNTSVASGRPLAQDSTGPNVQFFPEGGTLVRGLRSRVAFQLTGLPGPGSSAQGQVLDEQGTTVATFSARRGGMGSFLLTPTTAGNRYTAILSHPRLPRPVVRRLPSVAENGYVLRVADSGPAQVTLTVQATPDQDQTVLLLVHARHQAALAQPLRLTSGSATLTLAKSQLPEGVSHFTLFTTAHQPLCDRLFFQRPRQRLALDARPDKSGYTPREKVRLQLTASSPTGTTTPPAALSVAVYRLDSLNADAPPTIDHYLGLTSELRGTVDNPAYYFTATGPEVAEATEDLLLTQGWSRFGWDAVFAPAPAPPAFLPEPYGPVVRAKLTRAGTDQPYPDLLTYLSVPGRLVRLYNARSNAAGIVQFETPDVFGSPTVVLQTDPRQDSTCQITLLSPFSARFAPLAAPPFALVPRFEQAYARRHLQTRVQALYANRQQLPYLAATPDSTPFYGRPGESYLLDRYTRFKVLEEVLREYVQEVAVRIRPDGFHLKVVDKLNSTVFTENPMVLLDGVPVFNMNKVMALNPLKIRRLDVIDSRYVHGGATYSGLVSLSTYEGNLEGFALDPRVLIQEYEGRQQQREFYSPRYETPQQKQSRRPDFRELLYWNPQVTTTTADGAGQTLEFYTGDQPGRYRVVVQGLAATGAAGSTSCTFEVAPNL
ncbi:hypothetical protein D0T11_10695 [Hymenobacter rubripertinctus]|uniref:Macroglobulin domain-containing protein n=1 Tax=Hymenobacter rubripertinctus TaxID=2029981 RepID=A0A418QXZ3_9BACT|nr:hypothetical protein D0T11_10695 [Hymenobacter rubripertinctus]